MQQIRCWVYLLPAHLHEWKFYENLTRNTFVDIDYERFKKLLLNQMRQYTNINERAKQRADLLIEEIAQKRLTEERIQRITTQLIISIASSL